MDCPACGTPVTLELGPDLPPSTSLTDAVLSADADESIEVTRACLNCGWKEARQIRVESIQTTDGDAGAVKRAALIDEITEEVIDIEDIDSLEEILDEVRRYR